jgi:hypothetical protein
MPASMMLSYELPKNSNSRPNAHSGTAIASLCFGCSGAFLIFLGLFALGFVGGCAVILAFPLSVVGVVLGIIAWRQKPCNKLFAHLSMFVTAVSWGAVYLRYIRAL